MIDPALYCELKWRNITPAGLGATQINAIDASPHQPGKAYLAVTGYKLDDFTPHIYRTTDFGFTWRHLVNGLPDDTFVRVVREDPERQGLLYAGTEAGMFVSFDDGERWQSLQLNFPPVPITDLMVRRNSLVAATQGRAFWVLDDLTPLRGLNAEIAAADHHLYPNADVHRLMRRGGFTRKPGKNPPRGAVIRMFFRNRPDPTKTRVAVEIINNSDQVIRRFANTETADANRYHDNLESHHKRGKPYGALTLKPGMNELVWDLRREHVSAVKGHLIPSGWRGPRVIPGDYTIRLQVGDQVQEQKLRVRDDPRRDSKPDFAEFDSALADVYTYANDLHAGIERMREARRQIERLVAPSNKHEFAPELAGACTDLIAKIQQWEAKVIQAQRETQQDVANFQNRLSMQLLALMSAIDASDPPVTAGARQRLTDLQVEWQAAEREMKEILEVEVGKLNDLLGESGVRAVHVPKGR